MCEIVALGCLVAHDIKKTMALRKTYQADKIIAQMEELKRHFYPQRIEWKLDKGDKGIIARPDLPHLSKNELKQLWREAGNYLHRTPMVKLSEPENIVKKLKPTQSNPENFADIFKWGEKIAGLLDCHLITLEENKKVMSVSLISDDTTSVKVSILDFDTETETVDVSSLKFGEFR